MIFLEVGSPFSIGSHLKFHGKQDRTEHIRRKPWWRTKVRITVSHQGVQVREVKVPEFLNDLPCRSGERRSSIRIIFAQLFQEIFLVGGMTARVARFQ